MAVDNLSIIDVAEAPRLLVESEKNTLEELRVELYGASRDVISSYKRYLRAKGRVGEKRSMRNLSKLSKAEMELGMFLDGYSAAHDKILASLSTLSVANDKYISELYLSDDTSGAKKAARAMDSYVRKIERYIDKVDDSVASISTHYKISINAAEDDRDTEMSQKTTNDAPKNVPNTAYVHSNEVEVSPVSIDIGPTIERAVERAIAELSSSLEKRIATTVAEAKLPSGESCDAELLVTAAERVGCAAKALEEVLGELDKVVADVGAMVEKCRAVVDMQRSATREMQGIEVKQRLVNQEQAALIEAQEVVLQHQKLLAEKHAEITEAQSISTDVVTKIVESQKTIDASLKESIKVQKSLLASNAKYVEKLNKRIERVEEETDGE